MGVQAGHAQELRHTGLRRKLHAADLAATVLPIQVSVQGQQVQRQVIFHLACRRLDQLAEPEHQEAVTAVVADRSPATVALAGSWRRRPRAAAMASHLVLLSWPERIG